MRGDRKADCNLKQGRRVSCSMKRKVMDRLRI